MKKFFTTLLLLSVYGYSFAAQGYVSKDVAKVDWRFRRWTNTTTKTQTLTPTITTTPSITMTPSPSMTGTHGILLSTTPSNTPVYTDTPVYTNTPTVTKTNTLTPENMEQADLSVWLKLTETPTWVPSMTPSPTMTPTPYAVIINQEFSPYLVSISTWGDGGWKSSASVTFPYVPSSISIFGFPKPSGLNAAITYQIYGGVVAGQSSLLTQGTGVGNQSLVLNNCHYLSVAADNITPTPGVTPSPQFFYIQPKY